MALGRGVPFAGWGGCDHGLHHLFDAAEATKSFIRENPTGTDCSIGMGPPSRSDCLHLGQVCNRGAANAAEERGPFHQAITVGASASSSTTAAAPMPPTDPKAAYCGAPTDPRISEEHQ